MAISQTPSGQFGEARKKLVEAQAEAMSVAIRDYAALVRGAIDAYDSNGDEGTFLTVMQRNHETVTNNINSIRLP